MRWLSPEHTPLLPTLLSPCRDGRAAPKATPELEQKAAKCRSFAHVQKQKAGEHHRPRVCGADISPRQQQNWEEEEEESPLPFREQGNNSTVLAAAAQSLNCSYGEPENPFRRGESFGSSPRLREGGFWNGIREGCQPRLQSCPQPARPSCRPVRVHTHP